jgi:hypothetical protein
MKYFYQLVRLPKRNRVSPRNSVSFEDADWQGPTNEGTVEYFNLKPGRYTFRVQAVDCDLNYSEPKSLDITILLPFYMKAGFLIPTAGLSVILLATLIVLATSFIKHRRQIRAYERAAMQELQDAHHVQMSLMPASAPPIEGAS